MSEKDVPFLGKGWSFPPQFKKEHGQVLLTSGEEDIKKSLEILLSTSFGERVMRPDYGCNLRDLMYESLTTTLATQIKEMIKTAILYHEPRIKVNHIALRQSPDYVGRIDIHIEFTIKITNSRRNLVYPFYTNEATDV